ncbi:DUF2441 domain-containing protein [Halobacteriovorax sp. DA5]|uniref:DUF2441 domain-containing protein n=1 Tax=Halobacteriovorax sp. DA5 TaxID=2067553 RepID=UPI000CD23109|nr:DUF2441 domain-containing protein [Halobacteriovorax sp. DA5]POB15139.1 hypothetical protein C0Z22_01795 [Halobacteriovorax sp. DA5]
MKQTFLHLTQDLNLKKGDVIDTTVWMSSNYYNGKWNLATKPIHIASFGETIVNVFKRIISNSQFEKLKPFFDLIISQIADGKSKTLLLKEYLFENTRTESYSNLPSRLKCIFMYENNVDALAIHRTWGFKGNFNLLKLELENGVIHKADPKILDCDLATPDEWLRKHSVDYWDGKSLSENPVFEILGEGKFKIVAAEEVVI